MEVNAISPLKSEAAAHGADIDKKRKMFLQLRKKYTDEIVEIALITKGQAEVQRCV